MRVNLIFAPMLLRNSSVLFVLGEYLRNTGVVKTGETGEEASTRRRVAASILRYGPSTAAQLAERLDMTAAGVRRHLGQLLESGDVEERDTRPSGSRGRPSKAFALTDIGRATFHQSYDELAIKALDFLHASGGDDAVRAFAEARARDVEEHYTQIMANQPDIDPADALAQALNEAGFVAATEPVGNGEQLCQHHCPVASVAEKYPQLCQAETEVFSRILGSHVLRLATIAHGDTVCTTHIPLTPATLAPAQQASINQENDEH